MSYGTSFDDFEFDGELNENDQKPFFTVAEKSKEELLRWLNQDFENKRRLGTSRINVYREQLALYKGIHYRSQELRSQDYRRDNGDVSARNPKIVINHTYDMVESKTAKLTRLRPAIAVLPANMEYHDKQNAKLVKVIVDNRWYEVDVDGYLRDQQKGAYLYGEAYVKTTWDKDLGPEHPELKRAKAEGQEVPLLNNGVSIHDEDGEKVNIKESVKIGDVAYKVTYPDRVFFNLSARCWDEATDVTEIEYRAIDEVKADYPKNEREIKLNSGTRFDYESLEERKLKTEIGVMEYWHRPTKYLPRGKKIVFTSDTILESGDFPYEHGKLPYTRLTDIDVPSEFYSRSFISNIRQLQRHYNNLASAVARNHGLASAPKWIMPAGACSIKSLGNSATIVEYKGGVPPRLESMNPTHPEIFNYMDKLERNIEKISSVHGISRGAPPPSIRAGVALQFLDEQEHERESSAIAKRNTCIRDLARQTIALMGQYYKDEDERLINILGKDNTHLMKSFKMADFSQVHDVRIQNSSSLPDSKPAKIQTILDLNNGFPNLFTAGQIIDMLDLGTDQAFKDAATIAVTSAESENEAMMTGEELREPTIWEDLFTHWKIHLQKLQEMAFKEAPQEVQAALLQHIGITEMLMSQRGLQNQLFRQKLMTLDAYPAVFVPDDATKMMLAGMIPAVDPNIAQPMADDQSIQPAPPAPAPQGQPEA